MGHMWWHTQPECGAQHCNLVLTIEYWVTLSNKEMRRVENSWQEEHYNAVSFEKGCSNIVGHGTGVLISP